MPANIVHESDNCVAFTDINPVAPNHILFIPKKHIESVDKNGMASGLILFLLA